MVKNLTSPHTSKRRTGKNEKIFYRSEGSPGKYIVILMLDRLGQDLSFAMFLYLILIL